MDFKKAAILGSYISKDYAEPLFRLLVNYESISASEAASRLGLHIRTVQDFLEAMIDVGVLQKQEVFEKKRPYFRYTLLKQTISMEINLNTLLDKKKSGGEFPITIRERNNSGARFSTARNGQFFSNVTIWTGDGRDSRERKISLTEAQGRFLFNLPFPNATPESIGGIMKKAEIQSNNESEIRDIVNVLIEYKVIEKIS